MLPIGIDGSRRLLTGDQPVRGDQVLHGEVHAGQRTAGGVGHVPAGERPGGEQDRVVPLPELRHGDVHPDRAAGHELHALGTQLRQAQVDVALLQLEVGDAVPRQAAQLVVALVHGDRVPGPG
jgi:hypothetical protein